MTKYFMTPGTASSGIGNDTVVNGSKVIDYLSQSGHTTFDLYCPVIKSTTID